MNWFQLELCDGGMQFSLACEPNCRVKFCSGEWEKDFSVG